MVDKFPTILIPPAIAAIATMPDRLPAVLAATCPPAGLHYKPPKGHSETQFERDLWQYFPGLIHTGLLLPRPDCDQPYIPDFAYIDPALNLHIDIEVDEPYAYGTGQPLHYRGSEKDEQRNQFFLAAGWIVMRFSEEQVVTMPQRCCKAIASTIASITQDNHLMTAFRAVPTLKAQTRWTETEASQMAAIQHRERYLAQVPTPSTAKRNRKGRARAGARSPVATSRLTVYCPACGDGPISFQGHYIACPTCRYDAFVL